MITEISGFGIFLSKNGRFVTHICFSKVPCWNPNFYSFFGCALFWPSCQKREILDTHQKTKENFDWQLKSLFFGVFLCCFCFLVLFFFSCFCKMWKVIVFWAIFWGKFWLMFKKHYKHRYFSTFFKAKKTKIPFFKVINWAKLKLLIGPSLGTTKGQLGPANNFENLRAKFPFY